MNGHITNIGVRGKSIVSHTDSSSFRNKSAEILLGINITLVLLLICAELFVFIRKKLKKYDR
jgi:hypothetical protein